MWYIVGLGNPGVEFKGTRHNIGRDIVSLIAKNLEGEFKADLKSKSQVAKGKVGNKPSILILPDTGMNLSGKSVAMLVKKSESKNLLVIRDDIDMGQGSMKLVFNRGTGGHRGVDSIQKNLKTEEFYQLKVGILPLTPSGKPKKPKGEDKVISLVMGEWKAAEEKLVKKEMKRAAEAVETLLNEGFPKAATLFNS